MAWTDERVETLRKLWAEGVSATQIANKLGDVSRNAVIGKVHRLGLPGRATAARVSTARVNGVADASGAANGYQPQEKVKAVVPEPLLSEEERGSVLHLTEHTCKWPIGDPGSTDFHFCGARSKVGSPYCITHAAQAYQPLERRRKTTKRQSA